MNESVAQYKYVALNISDGLRCEEKMNEYHFYRV